MMGKDKAAITIIGAGSWGTALAMVLADNQHEVRLWGHNEKQINEINQSHTNGKYLPGIQLPLGIKGYSSLAEAVKGIETIVLAVPTKAYREVLGNLGEIIKKPVTLVHVSKGIEPDTLLRISEMIEQVASPTWLKDIVVLSGPSHAEEVSLRHPTTVAVSAKNMKAAEYVQDLFMNQRFRVYTNPDLLGVEIGGALEKHYRISCRNYGWVRLW